MRAKSAAQPGIDRSTIIAIADCRSASRHEQRAIADYLDRETARLDGLVAAKERVLGLLAEKRRALITRAVTRGLDPRAPLRDSGIPWLGEIPAHWETASELKWLFRDRDERYGQRPRLTIEMVLFSRWLMSRLRKSIGDEEDVDQCSLSDLGYEGHSCRVTSYCHSMDATVQGAIGVAIPMVQLFSPITSSCILCGSTSSTTTVWSSATDV